MIRVLIVDDQALIRVGLTALIQAAPSLGAAGQAASGEEAVHLAQAVQPDVIIMDVEMPGMGGIAATERILARPADHRPAVLMLTAYESGAVARAALLAGASGVLLKETPPERLIATVHIAAAGETVLSSAVARRLSEYAGAEPAITPGPQTPGLDMPGFQTLTARETDVLRLVGRAISNAEIACRLGVAEATVKTHLNRLMSKLNLSSRAQVVAFAYDCGLVPHRGCRIASGAASTGFSGQQLP